jgi:hypothetical protein
LRLLTKLISGNARAGFNIIGGGGSANFESGIPSSESRIASIGASLIPIDEAITDMTPGLPPEVVQGLNGNADALDLVSSDGEMKTFQKDATLVAVGLDINL